MDKAQLKILKRFYKSLHDQLIIDNHKLKKNSIFISFLDIKSTKRFNYLSKSRIKIVSLPTNIVDFLIEKDYIRLSPGGELDHYVITAKGIWEIEKINNIISNQDFINFIDKKFFNFKRFNKNITDKEKVILLSLIAIRSFSLKAALNLHTDNVKMLNTVKDLLDRVFTILLENNCFKNYKKNDDLYGKSKTLHPVINLIVHTDSLPKKTRGLFKSKYGVTTYYLELSKNAKVDIKGLAYLLWLIFENEITMEIEEKILKFCYECNLDYATKLYSHDNLIFTKAEYDDVLKEAMDFYFENRNKWKH